MSSDGSYNVIVEPTRSELKVRGSRFIGTAVPVTTKEQAMAELARVRKEFWDATHNCYAYRLAPDGLEYRFSDDGEPSGSAGKPILFLLQQRGVVDVLVIVTRYFGGTKLGVGGLVRAYSDTTQAVLDLVPVRTVYPNDSFRIFTPYEDLRVVRQLVERYALNFREEFHDVVNFIVALRTDQVAEFSAQLTEASNGRAGMISLESS